MAGKIKLSLDGNAIKQFFLNHVEKIALAIGAVCMLYLSYGAFGHEKETRTPGDLERTVTNSNNQIASSESPAPDPVPTYAPDVEKFRGEINLARFEVPLPVCPPVMQI